MIHREPLCKLRALLRRCKDTAKGSGQNRPYEKHAKEDTRKLFFSFPKLTNPQRWKQTSEEVF